MKEPIVLLKAIKYGCYSDNLEERENSKGGLFIQEGATYTYGLDPNWANGHGYYYCGTHIIMERNIDWTMFCKQSEYYEIIDRVKKQLIEEKNNPNKQPL